MYVQFIGQFFHLFQEADVVYAALSQGALPHHAFFKDDYMPLVICKPAPVHGTVPLCRCGIEVFAHDGVRLFPCQLYHRNGYGIHHLRVPFLLQFRIKKHEINNKGK